MIHWCGDETAMVVGIFSGFGAFVAWVKAKWHHFRHHRSCKEDQKLLARMQNQRAALQAAFNATPEELGRAAVRAAEEKKDG